MKYVFLVLLTMFTTNSFADIDGVDIDICIADANNYVWATVDSGNDTLLELDFDTLTAKTLYFNDYVLTECRKSSALEFEGKMAVCREGENIVLEVDDRNETLFRVVMDKYTTQVISFERYDASDNSQMRCL